MMVIIVPTLMLTLFQVMIIPLALFNFLQKKSKYFQVDPPKTTIAARNKRQQLESMFFNPESYCRVDIEKNGDNVDSKNEKVMSALDVWSCDIMKPLTDSK